MIKNALPKTEHLKANNCNIIACYRSRTVTLWIL